MEEQRKRVEGRGNHRPFWSEEQQVVTSVLPGAVLHEDQPLCTTRITPSSRVQRAPSRPVGIEKRRPATHGEVGLAFHQARRQAVPLALEQRDGLAAAATAASTKLLYGDDHRPAQVPPRRVSVLVLESVKAAPLTSCWATALKVNRLSAHHYPQGHILHQGSVGNDLAVGNKSGGWRGVGCQPDGLIGHHVYGDLGGGRHCWRDDPDLLLLDGISRVNQPDYWTGVFHRLFLERTGWCTFQLVLGLVYLCSERKQKHIYIS